MKKYFMFATVAIATLFASCSSDDFTAPKVASEDVSAGDALVPIQIGVGARIDVSTRGTGTVGGVGNGESKWYGQKINVFMTQKDAAFNTTLTLATQNGAPLYNDQIMYTPGPRHNGIPNFGTPLPEGQAMCEDGSIKYYPINGNFDFFGYHGNGDNNKIADIKWYDAENSEVDMTAEEHNIPVTMKGSFVIDGTNDLMSTKAVLTTNQNATMGTLESNSQRYYSAYSARKDVHPYLAFDHLLTRLQFNAGLEEVCYKEIANPSNIITKASYDKMMTQDKYEVKDYVHKTTGESLSIDDWTNLPNVDAQNLYEARFCLISTPNDEASWISKIVFDALYANEAAKAAAYEETNNVQPNPEDPYFSGLKVTGIKVFSKKSGKMLVAWTAAETPQRLEWDEASEETTDWMVLKQRSKCYMKNDNTDYMTIDEWNAQSDEDKATNTPNYTLADNPNGELEDLDNVASNTTEFKQVGEALLVSLPVASKEPYADASEYEMLVSVKQRKPASWTKDETVDYVINDIPVSIKVPNDGVFQPNTSYNVNMTLYGLERIDVFTTIKPWEEGDEIPLVID